MEYFKEVESNGSIISFECECGKLNQRKNKGLLRCTECLRIWDVSFSGANFKNKMREPKLRPLKYEDGMDKDQRFRVSRNRGIRTHRVLGIKLD